VLHHASNDLLIFNEALDTTLKTPLGIVDQWRAERGTNRETAPDIRGKGASKE